MNYQNNPYAAPQAEWRPMPPALSAAQPWTVGEVMSIAWDAFKQNWPILVLTYFVAGMIGLPFALAPTVLTATGVVQDGSDTALTIKAVSLGFVYLVILYLQVGLMRIWLAVARRQAVSFGTVFLGADRFLPFLAAFVLVMLAVGIGLVFLIVPGIILGLGFSLAPFYTIDANMGPIAALKESWKATKGQWGSIFLLHLAVLGMMLLGYAMCCVGLYATGPIALVAVAAAYTRMSGITPAPPLAPAQPGGPQPPYGGQAGPYGGSPGYGGGGQPPGFGGPPGYGGPPQGYGGPPPGYGPPPGR
jgi:uncharacterized membrane protein